jgi:uncharacterized protein
MSQLNTNDPDTARTFYAAVFGWETETFDLAGARLTMWKLPGYVGGEPQQPVARDVIATMRTSDSDRADPAPPWSVDFWIGQLDEAPSKATNLGGKVTGGTHDIPDMGMRYATIIDPHCATLSLDQPAGVR